MAESRKMIYLTDHWFIYEDDPFKILYQEKDGKIKMVRYASKVTQDVIFDQFERGIMQSILALYNEAFDDKQNCIKPEFYKGSIIDYLPEIGQYLKGAKPKETKQEAKGSQENKGEQEEQGESQEAMITPSQQKFIESLLKERKIAVSDIGKPLDQVTMKEAFAIIEKGKNAKPPAQKPAEKKEEKQKPPPAEQQEEPPQDQGALESYNDKLVPSPTQMFIPDVDRAVQSMRAFQDIKRRLLVDSDYMVKQGKKAPIKSGCRKFALAFRLKLEILRVEKYTEGDQKMADVYTRATAPDGAFMDGFGQCDSETVKQSKMADTWHNVISKAQTRSYNRAILDLVGGGEVSGEEIE